MVDYLLDMMISLSLGGAVGAEARAMCDLEQFASVEVRTLGTFGGSGLEAQILGDESGHLV